MTAVDARTGSSNRGDVDHTAPFPLKHVRDRELCDKEARAEVDVDGVVPLFDADIEDIARALAISRIYDEDVWVLSMLLLNLVEETLQVIVFGYIALVGAELAVAGLRFQLVEQLIYCAFVRAVCESERCSSGEEIACTCCAYPALR